MKTMLNHKTYGDITYEESFWTGRKNISINGKELTKKFKNTFQTECGQDVTISGNYLMGAKMTIGSEMIPLTRSVKWYEIMLSLMPFLFVLIWGNSVALCQIIPIVGGAIGEAVSGLLSMVNLVIIKSLNKIWLKILVSILMLSATFLICYLVAFLILQAL